MVKRKPCPEQMALVDAPASLACAIPSKKYPGGRTGTVAGLQAHRAVDEQACAECRVASAAYVRSRSVRVGPEEALRRREARKAARLSMYEGRQACEIPSKRFPDGRTGTPAGYQAHRDLDESPCAACVAAQTAKSVARINRLEPDKLAAHRKANAEASRRRKERDPEKVRAEKHRKMERNREIIRSAKAKPCHDCGVQYPYWVMQFDHRDRSQKRFNIGPIGPTVGEDRLRAEIAKCDIVCANCHFDRTFRENERLRRRSDAATAPQAGDAA